MICSLCNDTGSIITADDYDGMGRYQPQTEECPGPDGNRCPYLVAILIGDDGS